jgi:uncharacterized protein
MKIILDTNIYFSALGFGNKLLKLVNNCVENNKIEIYFSKETMDELENKLNGHKFSKIALGKITKQEINNFILTMTEVSNFAKPIKKFDICRDTKDNMILDLAFEIQADYIISGDEDLLTLNPFEGIKIVKPSEFMKVIEF